MSHALAVYYGLYIGIAITLLLRYRVSQNATSSQHAYNTAESDNSLELNEGKRVLRPHVLEYAYTYMIVYA